MERSFPLSISKKWGGQGGVGCGQGGVDSETANRLMMRIVIGTIEPHETRNLFLTDRIQIGFIKNIRNYCLICDRPSIDISSTCFLKEIISGSETSHRGG